MLRGILRGSPAILPFRIGRKLTVHGITSLRNEGMVTLARDFAFSVWEKATVHGITSLRNEGMVTLAGDFA